MVNSEYEELKKQYNEKQLILLEFGGGLVYERDKTQKLLSDTEENRKYIEKMYDRKIKLINEMIEEYKDNDK